MWTAERITCSGESCARDAEQVDTRADAVNLVLDEIPWQRDGEVRHVVARDGWCYEDQARALLERGDVLELDAKGVHYAYRVYGRD